MHGAAPSGATKSSSRSCDASDAARIIPFDSTPANLRGCASFATHRRQSFLVFARTRFCRPTPRASASEVYECTCAVASFAVGMRYRMKDLTVKDMRSVDYLQMIGQVVAAFQHFVHECTVV